MYIKSIVHLSEKIDELSIIKQDVSQILSLVNKLQSIITEKDKQIGVLEARIDVLEQYQKRKTLLHPASKQDKRRGTDICFLRKVQLGKMIQKTKWNH